MANINYCIEYLKKVNRVEAKMGLDPESSFRALQNITMPYALSDEFYAEQDEVLKEILSRKTVVDVETLTPLQGNLCLYRGDITLLKADAIVNACNSKMLGCFVPWHRCIDNAIHSFAGLEVRRDMMKVMQEQGHDEKNGDCKVTKGYNLPAKYIFHTVGPIYSGSKQDEIDLRNCYLSCLKKADEMKLQNIVFCSLSTGVFGYPIEEAALIAVNTVKEYLRGETSLQKVIFNVFSEGDEKVYERILKN